MVGKKEYVARITPAEALEIFQHATSEDMYIAKGLYDAYRKAHGTDSDYLWDVVSLMAFAYTAGTIQGIREARQKEQGKRNIA